MVQLDLSPFVGLDAPQSKTLEDRVNFGLARASSVLGVNNRTFEVNTAKLPSFVKEGGQTALITGVYRIEQAYLRKTTAAQFKQWGMQVSKPVIQTNFEVGCDRLQTALEDVVTDGTIEIGSGTGENRNLRFARHYSDLDADLEFFPYVYDFTEGGDLNDAPELEDYSKLNSRSLAIVTFSVKLWDKANLFSDSTGSTVDSPSKAKKAGGKGKGKAKASDADGKHRSYGARLEMLGIWYLGRDEDAPGEEGSPRKCPRI